MALNLNVNPQQSFNNNLKAQRHAVAEVGARTLAERRQLTAQRVIPTPADLGSVANRPRRLITEIRNPSARFLELYA